MSGGSFNLNQPKVRPGTYINVSAEPRPVQMLQDRGTVILPVLLNWGDSKKIIKILAEYPDDLYEKIGYRSYAPEYPLPIREAIKKAQVIKVFNLNTGDIATATEGDLTVTAKYPGTRGNDLTIVIGDNPIEGKDVLVYLDTRKILEFNKVTKIEDLASNESWVLFSGSGDLENTAGLKLEGGTDSVVTNQDIIDFMEELEFQDFNAVAFPYDDSALKTSIKTMIYNFREHIGKYVQAVVPDFKADYEGIISVLNGVYLGEDTPLTASDATYYIAAASAAATNTESLTRVKYDGATDIYGRKNHTESEQAIEDGHLFFSKIDGEILIEYDINTLISFDDNKSESYSKNRVIRVLDTFRSDCQRILKPNKYDNNEEGFRLAEDDGKLLERDYENNGAIKNVDYDADFVVDRNLSVGDSMYIFVGLEPVDSSDKLYVSIKTR